MQTAKNLTTFLTLLAFLSSTTGLAATSNSTQPNINIDPSKLNNGTGGFTNPTYSPYALNLQPAFAELQKEMNKCTLKALGNTEGAQLAKDAAKNLLLSNKYTKPSIGTGGSCYASKSAKSKTGKDEAATVDTSGFTCDMTCEEPTDLADGASCDIYYKDDGADEPPTAARADIHYPHHVPVNKEKLTDAIARIQTYTAFLRFKKTGCLSKDKAELDRQVDAYKCMTGVMDAGIAAATKELQAGLQKNNDMFGKMNQFQQEIGDQIRQIDETLGPDPTDPNAKGDNAQFGGLLGIQKELKAQLVETDNADFKTRISKWKKDVDGNEQTLEAGKMSQTMDCMKGNRKMTTEGAGSLYCNKPAQGVGPDGKPTLVTDKSGNVQTSNQSCGALEYLESQAALGAYVTERGVQTGGGRKEKAQQNAGDFRALIDAMMRDMGGYDPGGATGKLVGRLTAKDAVMKKYSSAMRELSTRSGVNIQQQMGVVLNTCYKDGDDWKRQQIKSVNSDYNTKNAEIDAFKVKLDQDLNKGLRDLNSTYGHAMAVMYGQHVTLNRFQCSTTDSKKMESCYTSIAQNLQNVLEGNGSSTGAMKPISGGAMVPGFAIPCKGINGCVTAFQNVRKQKKDQNAAAQKAKVKFVSDGNAQVSQAVQNFAGQLAEVQKTVKAQFSRMSQILGVDAPEEPNKIAGEALEPSEGPNKEPGPYKSPKNMAAVLSGLAAPNGLVDSGNSGLREMIKAAQTKIDDKKKDADDKLKTYAAAAAKFNGLNGECTKGDKHQPSQSSASSGESDSNNCDEIVNACAALIGTEGSGTSPLANLADIQEQLTHYIDMDQSDRTDAEAKNKNKLLDDLNRYKNLSQDERCRKSIKTCKTAVAGAKKAEKTTAAAQTTAGPAGSAAGSSTAPTTTGTTNP